MPVCPYASMPLHTEAFSYEAHFVVQLDTVLLEDASLRLVLDRGDVGGRGVSGVDQEIAVLVGELRTAYPIAAHADAIEQAPGWVVGRVLEEAAGVAAPRLRLEAPRVVIGDTGS